MLQALRNAGRDRGLTARVALLLLAFTVPLLGAGTLLITQQNARVADSSQQDLGVRFLRADQSVVTELRRYRDDLRLSRGAAVNADHVSKALRDLGGAPPMLSGNGIARTRVDQVAHMWLHTAAMKSIAEAERTIETAVALGIFEDERTEVAGDSSDAPTQGLLNAFGAQVPTVSDAVDRAQTDLLEGARAATPLNTREFSAALSVGQAAHAFVIAHAEIANAQRSDPALQNAILPNFVRASQELESFTALASPPITSSPAAILRQAAAVREALDPMSSSIFAQIERRLGNRQADERQRLLLFEIETGLAVFVTFAMMMLLARTIIQRDRRELARARSDAEQLAEELGRQREIDALMMSETQLRAAFDRSSIGVAIIDRGGKIVRSNDALRDMIESASDAKLVGAGHANFDRLIDGTLEYFTQDLEIPDSRGGARWFESTISLVRDDDGDPRFALAMLKDVTDRRRAADRLRHEASHDPLSGLPNRSQFVDRLRATFFGGRESQGVSAVLFFDLDEFKFINDSLGHAVGDRVLVAVSRRLQSAIRDSDIVARFGGDEFAMLLFGRQSRAEIEQTVSSIAAGIAEPLLIDGREIFMTASIGVALADRSYTTVEQVLRDADTAMYFAKTAGRSRHAFFDREMHEEAARRLEIATQLRRALDRDQFYLAYQPVVSLATGEYEACETLLRWEHPQLGEVSPAEFIPIAEEIGMIVPIGRFVVERACAQLRDWKMRGIFERPPRLSVNASVREVLQVDYPGFIESMVERYGVTKGELTIEVTESTVLASGRFSSGALDRIKEAGVGLSIDDFGTGYSSLRYLQQFPFDELKIDRSFVSGSDGNLASEAIVSMLLSLSRAFGVKVTAEGVETPAQAARLRALGCTRGQGYLYGKPVRAELLSEYFRRASPFAS